MNHLIKLALPIGLGLAAAVLNWTTVSSRIQPHYFVRVSEDLKVGDKFSDNNLERFALSGELGGLSKTAFLWKDRVTLFGRLTPRDLEAGDIVFLRDATSTEHKMSAQPGELVFRIDYRGINAVPEDIRVGEMVSIKVGTDENKLRRSDRSSQDNVVSSGQIGPFRVLEVGGIDPKQHSELSTGYIKIAVRSDDPRFDRLDRAVEGQSTERVLGIFEAAAK